MAVSPEPSKLKDRQDALPIALFLLLIVLMFQEFFFAHKMIFDRDLTLWELPARRLCAQLLKEGHFALWTDAYGNGQPFLANLKSAVLYPATLLYLVFPFFMAFKLYYFIHVGLLWTGLYYLGRSYALSRRAAFLGASLFVFSGMFLSSFEFYNHIAALAWLPWILISLRTRPSRFPRRLAALAVLWTLSLLSGAPEITLITLVLAILQTWLVDNNKKTKILLTAASLLLAILISAAQVLPSFDLWKQSERSSSQFSDWPLEMVQFLNLAFPDILGNDREPEHDIFWGGHFFDRGYPLYYSLYIGLGAILLALSALAKPRDRKVLFLGIAFFLFLLLASGKYSPLAPVVRAVPFLSSIRYPAKFFVGSMISLCLLAGCGFDKLFIFNQIKRRSGYLLASAAAALTILLAIFLNPVSDLLGRAFSADRDRIVAEVRTSLRSAIILLAACALLFLFSMLRERPRHLISLIITGVLIMDLAYHNRHINPLISTSFFATPDGLHGREEPVRLFREDDVPKNLSRGSTNIRTLAAYARRGLYPLAGIADGIFYLFDKDTLDIYPKDYRALEGALLRISKEDRLKVLQLEGCQVVVGHTPLPGLADRADNVEGFPVHFQELEASRPAVGIIHNFVVARSWQEKLHACLDKEFNPLETVIVEKDIPFSPPTGRLEEETVDVLEDTQGRKRFVVKLSAPGLIVWLGNYDRGWKARVDGRPAEVFGANLASKAVFVPAGRHAIEVRYSPGSWRTGIIISLSSLVLLVGTFFASAILQRKER